MDSNMAKRIAFAAVAIPVAVGLVWLGGWPLAILLAVVGILGARELVEFAERQGIRPSRPLGLGAAALFGPGAWLVLSSPRAWGLWNGSWMYLGAVWLIAVLSWALLRRSPTERPLGAVAVTVLAPLYTAALPAFLIGIRHAANGLRSWPGTALVFFPLIVTWVCDTAAMLGGRAIGGPKLAPTVSPGKTRSGAIAGVVGAAVAAPLFAHLALRPAGVQLSLAQAVAFGVILSLVGQAGDLAESLLKREVGVKDSSALIPGHGGVLDRFDSLYFVVPVAAGLYRLFGIL
jgi:phosphatidate cytidylyltransferase